MDAATLAKHLDTHLRVATFPVGILPLAPGAPLPPKAKRPKKDLGIEVAICQSISFARRYGWTLAFDGDDLSCPIAKVAFGFRDRIDFYEQGSLAEGMYASCAEAGKAFEEEVAAREDRGSDAIDHGGLIDQDLVQARLELCDRLACGLNFLRREQLIRHHGLPSNIICG